MTISNDSHYDSPFCYSLLACSLQDCSSWVWPGTARLNLPRGHYHHSRGSGDSSSAHAVRWCLCVLQEEAVGECEASGQQGVREAEWIYTTKLAFKMVCVCV